MSGYDRRVASAFVALGYDLFPFAAFDHNGRLVVPASVQYPQHVKAGLGRVAAEPVWERLYRTLSVLDDPQWNVFCAGVGFSSSSINVVLFKAISGVSNAEAARQWAISYQTTVARTLREYAGTRHVIDPKWLSLINTAIDQLPTDQKANDPAGKRPGGGEPERVEDVTASHDQPPADEVAATGVAPWLLLGLRALAGILGQFTPKNEVRTTIFWYPARTDPLLDMSFASRWTPLHADLRHDGKLRAVSAIWEPRADGPRVIHGSGVDWGAWFWSMPHMPWHFCRALYPTLNCGGPSAVSMETRLMLAESPPVGDMVLPPVGDELPSRWGDTESV